MPANEFVYQAVQAGFEVRVLEHLCEHYALTLGATPRGACRGVWEVGDDRTRFGGGFLEGIFVRLCS